MEVGGGGWGPLDSMSRGEEGVYPGAGGWARRPADASQQALSSDLPLCTVNRRPQRAWTLLGTCATRVRRAAQGFSSYALQAAPSPNLIQEG